uniref:endonuclease MutS2 n=1 Tax=Candidatus Enterococcus willemsii TaxID=1857215 RepID=UPI00403FAA27
MNTKLLQVTEFNAIKQMVVDRCISDYGKELLEEKEPATALTTVKKRLAETSEAMLILASGQHVPFMGLTQIKHLTTKIAKGGILEASELTEYSDFLRSFRLIANFFEKNKFQTPILAKYTRELTDFRTINEAIEAAIAGNRVKSEATRELKKVRGKITKLEGDIEKSCSKTLKYATANGWLQDRLIVKKEERYTLPVKTNFQSKIAGNIIERSSRGTTVFIEPEGIRKLNDQLILSQSEETAVIYQILASLTGMIAEEAVTIGYCMDIIVELDTIFAKAKYSQSIGGKAIEVNDEEVLVFDKVKHPLLDNPVPLDVSLGQSMHGMIITGPNAGGKTVVLKTIALVCLMSYFGLCINHGGKSSIGIFKKIFIDIGDQQSLENSLSTFSGHMKNISDIVRQTSRKTLILLDEIGSGTEPNEGAALAIATMEAMYAKGGTIVATTHYGEIKEFALQHEDFQTAAMAFDSETLTPQYRLLLNQVGESNAFWIAQKMALDIEILQKAQQYLTNKNYQTKQIPRKQQKVTVEKSQVTDFHKGDRVWSTELQKTGLFYEYQDAHQAQILVEKQFHTVQAKRLQLDLPATELYPLNYDVEQLFVDYHEQKFKRDIDRGSKKAQKKLRKMAEERKS